MPAKRTAAKELSIQSPLKLREGESPVGPADWENQRQWEALAKSVRVLVRKLRPASEPPQELVDSIVSDARSAAGKVETFALSKGVEELAIWCAAIELSIAIDVEAAHGDMQGRWMRCCENLRTLIGDLLQFCSTMERANAIARRDLEQSSDEEDPEEEELRRTREREATPLPPLNATDRAMSDLIRREPGIELPEIHRRIGAELGINHPDSLRNHNWVRLKRYGFSTHPVTGRGCYPPDYIFPAEVSPTPADFKAHDGCTQRVF